MSQDTEQDHILKKVVIYQIPDMYAVKVLRDVKYSVTGDSVLKMNIYYSPGFCRCPLAVG